MLGDEACKLKCRRLLIIKKLKNYRIPKVFVGISNDAKYQTVYLNDGFTAFLLSPIDELELMRLINKYFSNAVDGDNNV